MLFTIFIINSYFTLFVFSFHQGDVFVVDSVIDSDWLWVTAQKNQEKGLVPAALVEDAVSSTLNICFKSITLRGKLSLILFFKVHALILDQVMQWS